MLIKSCFLNFIIKGWVDSWEKRLLFIEVYLMERIGIIGGTGFSDLVKEFDYLPTDYGEVKYGILHIGGKDVMFIPRHRELEVPHLVNYRANVQAMKLKGINAVYQMSAAGRGNEKVLPGHLGVATDVDWDDLNREMTYAEPGLLLHASMTDPFSKGLNKIVENGFEAVKNEIKEIYNGTDLEVGFQNHGTYFNIQGPAFLTYAKEARLRETVYDMVWFGQTLVPEVFLLREMGIAASSTIMCVDHSNFPGQKHVEHATGVMVAVEKTSQAAVKVMDYAIANTPKDFYDPAHDAMKSAIHPAQFDAEMLKDNQRYNLIEIVQASLNE